jgi:hypothetical protein
MLLGALKGTQPAHALSFPLPLHQPSSPSPTPSSSSHPPSLSLSLSERMKLKPVSGRRREELCIIKLGKKVEVDDNEVQEVSWYIAEENDTPGKIAKHFRTVSAEQIVELNRAKYPELDVSSSLRKNDNIKLCKEKMASISGDKEGERCFPPPPPPLPPSIENKKEISDDNTV